MSLKYAIYFSLLTVTTIVASLVVASELWLRVVLLWTAVALGTVAVAYATGKPRLLMKRRDGSLPFAAWLLLWPYFVLARFSLWLYRLANRRSVAVAEVAPGVWFARRLTTREALSFDRCWAGVLDLAAEFPRAPIKADAYHSLPLLDGAVPAESQLREAVAWIDKHREHGPVLVHCALGHGRTGAVILTWLLRHGLESNIPSAITRLRALRSSFGVSTAQTACVERVTAVVHSRHCQ